jgi:hypothetical protein
VADVYHSPGTGPKASTTVTNAAQALLDWVSDYEVCPLCGMLWPSSWWKRPAGRWTSCGRCCGWPRPPCAPSATPTPAPSRTLARVRVVLAATEVADDDQP